MVRAGLPSSCGHPPGMQHGLDLRVGYLPLGVQAELGEKPTGQHAVVGPLAYASERRVRPRRQKPEEIRRREAGVEVDVDLVLTARLAVREAGERLAMVGFSLLVALF